MNDSAKNNINQVHGVELYAAVRDGDQDAFRIYYELTMPWLVPYIRRITQDTEDARNIAHDVFTKLWLQREQIDPAQPLDGLVSKMASNAAVDFARKRQSHSKYYGEQMFAQTGEDHAADVPMLADEMESRIEKAVLKMPAQRRKVYELSREENLTYHEIAERMGLSYNTVMNYMKLALQEIRAALASLFICLFMN